VYDAGRWQGEYGGVTIPAMNNTNRMRMGALAAAGVVWAAVSGGCVERKITIGSDPEGAVVSLNDEEIGRTPVTVPFVWYGDYDVVLRLEKNVGTPEKPVIKRYYLHTHKQTKTPAFEIIPIDLFAELLPVTFKDEQIWAFPIPEVQEPKDGDLIQRARDIKGTLDAPEELQDKKKPGAVGAGTQPQTSPQK
jgi:PEGA domain